ncbi:MAG: hypothetical protein KatS3mg108_3566 [Isosphaeraceae bacterium]|jgi:hypothetical protein|nr:MAG: hypothetical protein KatS3mg108_3566 [Isosphaeraceae bacterium]
MFSPTFATQIVLSLLLAAPPASPSAPAPTASGDDEAMRIAQEVTTTGAKLFAAKDAQGLADTYIDSGRIVLISRDEAAGGLKRDVREGRSAVLEAYKDLFQTPDPISAVNRVEYARLLGPEILEISGTLVLTDSNGMHRFPFTQLRVREGGFWRIAEVQIFLAPES